MSELPSEESSPETVPGHSMGLTAETLVDRIAALRGGVPFVAILEFQEKSQLSIYRIADVVDLSNRTMARRKKNGRFSPTESERLFRLANIYERAVQKFDGDPAAAISWLDSPCRALGDVVPLDFAKSELGGREVENVIGRLEHGVLQ